MWKSQNFSVTQILKNGVRGSSEVAVFAILGALNISFGKFQPSKSAKIHRYQNSELLNVHLVFT